MQLTEGRTGQVSRALGLLTAALFAAAGLNSQAAAQTADNSNINDDTASDLGLTRIDSAVLFYQEAGGRVRAIEPVASFTMNGQDGAVLSGKFTADTLTGATPNGAAPWKGVQTFTTPAQAPGTHSTVTGASGGSTIVTIPGTGTVARQYTTAPGALPVDAGFRDQRYAGEIGYSALLNPDTRLGAGGSFSIERDYRSFSFNGNAARTLFQKNTTVSLAVNGEFDQSVPFFGTPQAFTVMSATQKGSSASKTVVDIVAGVTQVMNRYWLAQINYSFGSTNGYQTDPYRIISVVDPLTGGPVQYLYEKRPGSRTRQSVYFGNKLALGPTVADISIRAYRDSWGITSETVEVAERVPLTPWLYVEPHYRYYSQTAASFFTNYLVSGQALPAFATSDSRLGKFTATTVGLKVGLKLTDTGELYLRGESYAQSGNGRPAGAIGDLTKENLFSGVKATSVILGYTFAFD